MRSPALTLAPRSDLARAHWLRQLLGLPLLWKILIANAVIATAGAVSAGLLARTVAEGRSGIDVVQAMFVPSMIGLVLSIAFNLLVLRAAFVPLRRLHVTIEAVRGGDFHARVRPALLSDPEVDQAGDTLNAMLDELETAHERLRALSSATIDAQEEERRRISRELHDDTAQSLTSLLLFAKALEQAEASPRTRAGLAELREQVALSLEGVRRLARELRPSALDDLGLVAALHGYVQDFSRRTGLTVSFDPACGGRLPAHIEIALYRIAQEALTNVAKHAGARAAVVQLVREPSSVSLTITDDGTGFEPAVVSPERGVGLFGMRERAELAGGTLDIWSGPGEGTVVLVRIPTLALNGHGA